MIRKILLGMGLSAALLIFTACTVQPEMAGAEAEGERVLPQNSAEELQQEGVSLYGEEKDWIFRYEDLPPYEGEESISVNHGIPFFADSDITTDVFENYSELDELGRCGAAFANVCRGLMPTQERGSIGNIRPSGWHTVKYDVIADRYL